MATNKKDSLINLLSRIYNFPLNLDFLGIYICNLISAMGIMKKITFTAAKVRYVDITMTRIFVKNLLFLMVHPECHNALQITSIKTSTNHTLNKVFNSSNFY